MISDREATRRIAGKRIAASLWYSAVSTVTKDMSETTRLRFHGGMVGALAPLALLLTGIISLGLAGAPDERGFWPLLLAAMALGLALASDRRRYAETLIAGMSQQLVAVMVMAWILAGVLGTLMSATGFIDALVWLGVATGVSGGAYAAAAFLICCLVSTSTGTSLGTILLCAPLLFPAGAALQTDPAILMGAILGGATFGDNISPVSDTTIASAGTQGAEVGAVVRTRLRYALPAAAIALFLYTLLGSADSASATLPTTGTETVAADAGFAALAMLVVPALVIALLLKRRHLLEGLFAGGVAACLMGLLLGSIQPADLLYVDSQSFGARGLLVDGVERAVGISIFTFLLMGLVAGLEATGIMDRLVRRAESSARTPRGAETWIFATVSAAVLLTTHSVVALLAVGPFTRRAGRKFGINPCRRANLLDATVCTWPFLVPYCIPTLLAASATAAGEAAGMPRLSPLAVGLHNFHSWALLAMMVLAVWTGYGRGTILKTPEADDV